MTTYEVTAADPFERTESEKTHTATIYRGGYASECAATPMVLINTQLLEHQASDCDKPEGNTLGSEQRYPLTSTQKSNEVTERPTLC